LNRPSAHQTALLGNRRFHFGLPLPLYKYPENPSPRDLALIPIQTLIAIVGVDYASAFVFGFKAQTTKALESLGLKESPRKTSDTHEASGTAA